MCKTSRSVNSFVRHCCCHDVFSGENIKWTEIFGWRFDDFICFNHDFNQVFLLNLLCPFNPFNHKRFSLSDVTCLRVVVIALNQTCFIYSLCIWVINENTIWLSQLFPLHFRSIFLTAFYSSQLHLIIDCSCCHRAVSALPVKLRIAFLGTPVLPSPATLSSG